MDVFFESVKSLLRGCAGGACRGRKILLFIVVLGGLAFACGPIYPVRMLGWGDMLLRSAPMGVAGMFPESAADAGELIGSGEAGEGHDPQAREAPELTTVQAELADLQLASPKWKHEGMKASLTRYDKIRREMVWFLRRSEDDSRQEAVRQWELDELKPHLPKEFQLYLDGALHYFLGDIVEAQKSWRSLLSLPAEQRKYKTTWSLWMLARTSEDKAESLKWYLAVCAAVDEGYVDSLGLMQNEQGWLAYFSYRAGDYLTALDIYLAAGLSGEMPSEEAARSVAEMLAIGLHKNEAKLMRECAQKADRGRALSLYLCQPGMRDLKALHELGRGRLLLQTWAGVLRVANPELYAELAGSLAVAAYQLGWYSEVDQFLQQASADDEDSCWVRAKMHVKAGRYALAEKEFEKYLLINDASGRGSQEVWDVGVYGATGKTGIAYLRRAMAYGDYASVLLARNKYEEALGVYLQGGFYADAAYIAESLLGVEELLQFVRDFDDSSRSQAYGMVDSGKSKQKWLHDLLSRRLTRENYFKGAQKYCDKKLQASLTEYVALFRQGRDTSLPRPQRARSFWQAANLRVEHGRSLFWLENGCRPYDRAVLAHLVEPSEYSKPRERDELIPLMGPDELRRLKAYGRVAQSMVPVHYYDAAEMAWQAAHLLPRQDPRAATMLWQAGQWIAAQDPEKADRYYQALVSRCGQTPLGKLADEKRWFPPWQEAWQVQWQGAAAEGKQN